ncbi:hypothetical protein QU24_13285 [Pantoea rodasii]|uniref:Uncharacterized protein n=2 Tax=Pantoea TaxID=53335 RepID=A0A0U3TFI0_9GAMM|nr:hypothetical protein LK04_03000 [Pantoea vagans]KHJ67559.1 hypothetical protein QU24_13285 [Pantoea rodasii]
MLKEQCGFATCLPNLAHKSRDNPAMGETALRHIAQHEAQRLQCFQKAGTLSATVFSHGKMTHGYS